MIIKKLLKTNIDNYIGIVFILLHSAFDIIFYVLCKVSQKNSVLDFYAEIAFVLIYNLKAFILLIAIFVLSYFLYSKNSLSSKLFFELNKNTIILYFSMSIFSTGGFLVFLYGLKLMLVANAISLKYLEQILWVIVGIFILKEKITTSQLAGIFISFLGIGIIIIDNLYRYYDPFICFFPITAALFWTISSTIGKHIVSNNFKLLNHMVYYYGFHTIVLLIFTAFICFLKNIKFSEMSYYKNSYEFLVHILSMSCFYIAMQISNMSLLAPFVYIKLIFSFTLGYFIFDEAYNILNLIGYILITFGGIKILTHITKRV